MSAARWDEYRRFLAAALDAGYRVVDLESWCYAGRPREKPTLVLRHDVDQHPRSVLPMLAAERSAGVRATWYFRWRTADPRITGAVREAGASVGLHYETLTRLNLATRVTLDDDVMTRCRDELRAEIAAFGDRHGTIESICPHGDTRVPGVDNAVLLRDEDPASYGVRFDTNEAMRGARLGLWLTDRTLAHGGWRDEIDPLDVFGERTSPILGVVHPNNWASTGSLRRDALLARALPGPVGRGPVRTRGDDPPPAG